MPKVSAENPFLAPRRPTRSLDISGLGMGSSFPIRIEGMAKTATAEVDATVDQIRRMEQASCELVRVAAPTVREARAIRFIRPRVSVPVMADIHFSTALALEAIEAGADSIRLNPGTIHNVDAVPDVAAAAADRGLVLRVGVNSGSLRAEVKTPAELPTAMAEEALAFCELLERHGFHDIMVSVKTSDVLTTIEAYRLVSARSDYPLHLGVTATGPMLQAAVRSALGIGVLLMEGIGDTVRVSMTAPPEQEVAVAWLILEALGIRRRGVELISCPTCGRCQIDLPALLARVEKALSGISAPLKVAVMGCVVNGPGEAAEADVGVAGGKRSGFIFRKGTRLRRVPEAALAEELLKEVRSLANLAQET